MMEGFEEKMLAMSKLTGSDKAMLDLIAKYEDVKSQDHMVFVFKGWVLTRMGDFNAAQSAFERALLLKPTSAWGNFRYGELLMKMDKPRDAFIHFVKACEKKPDRHDFWLARGECEYIIDKVKDAYHSFDSAIKKGDVSGFGLAGKSRIMMLLDMKSQAYETISEALQLDPENKDFKKQKEFISKNLN